MKKFSIIRKPIILMNPMGKCLTSVAVLPPVESRRIEGGSVATFLNGKESIT